MTLSNKLGSAIQVLEVMDPEFSTLGYSLPEITLGESGKCAHCGKAISWRVLCQNERGEVFVMGRTCALEDESVHKISLRSKEELAEERANRKAVESRAFITWAASKPHPKGWANKTLLDDVRYWAQKKPAYVKATLVAFRASKGEETSAPTLSKKDQQALALLHEFSAAVEKSMTDFEAACVAHVSLVARLKEEFEKAKENPELFALVCDSLCDAKAAKVPVFARGTIPTCGSVDHGFAMKLAMRLRRSGLNIGKVPAFQDTYKRYQEIATKYGVSFTFHETY